MPALEHEFEYYLKNQDRFVAQYDGKVVSIKGDAVIGVYDSEPEAVEEDNEN